MPDADPRHDAPSSYTGRTRRKKTGWTVKVSDLLARVVITVGGIGTIVAVGLVFVFLGWVVMPLFAPASLTQETRYGLKFGAERPVQVGLDEYQSMGWALCAGGDLLVLRLDTGEVIERRALFPDSRITAVSSTASGDDLAIGFADGTIRLGTIVFRTAFREPHEIPASLRDLAEGATAVLDQGVLQRTPQGQLRHQTVVATWLDPIQVAESAVERLDHWSPEPSGGSLGAKEHAVCVLTSAGALKYVKIAEKENAFLGTVTLEHRVTDLPLDGATAAAICQPLVGLRGETVFVIHRSGHLTRYDTRDPHHARVVEQLDLLSDSSAEVTVADFVLGRETIVCGDSEGGLRAWFRVPAGADAPPDGDGFRMALAHDLGRTGTPVRALGISRRSRMIAAGDEAGKLRLFFVTSEKRMLEHAVAAGERIEFVAFAPKDDGLLALTRQRAWWGRLDPRHPEATWAALFRPVWYEGYDGPQHIWQSSFAGNTPEMKLGLWPCVFGTLKATFYSMLFGAPLALLAAVYTSEFLDRSLRARIKPAVEMMASLPSVVLGFLAALWFAPRIQTFVPAVLVGFVTIPLALLTAAQLWQLLPHQLTLRLARYRFLGCVLVLPLGFAAAWWLGPWAERRFFAGDIKRWLDGQIGGGLGGWLMVLLPFCALGTLALVTLVINSRLRSYAQVWSRRRFAAVNLVKYLLAVGLMFGTAYGLSWFLTDGLAGWSRAAGWAESWPGFDLRGTLFDTYDERNALIVGFAMGFAIIPIIYTLADDALSTVPNHLRSGALGCGATPWQTAWTVVVPTAMSGLFSALMIGLGRAVGETMIVLMAAGNTPITEWNMFNGFRTLAANIAVELPEAVRNSTHYRTLFLSALTLFVLTFVINTAAEMVRLRFRKRAYQL